MSDPRPRAGTPHKNTSSGSIGYDESKLGWLAGTVKGDLLVGHASTVTPDKIRVTGLDPQYSPFDQIVMGGSNMYEQFVYAFALETEDPPKLCKAHRMSSWAVAGNYLYVFNAAGRRYMSSRAGLVNTEIGFPDLIPFADLSTYKIGLRHELTAC